MPQPKTNPDNAPDMEAALSLSKPDMHIINNAYEGTGCLFILYL